MQMNLLVASLCLLGTVILCGAQTSEEPSTAFTANPTPNPVTSSEPVTAQTDESTIPSTGSSATQTSVATAQTSVATAQTPEATPEASSNGLSPGAIAGISIGTIAGVAAIGGGVFGLLKYTNKI